MMTTVAPGSVFQVSATWRRALQPVASKVGAGLVVTVVAIAIAGPLVAPNSADAIIGSPFEPPTNGLLLGTDFLGRDAFSRTLNGGWYLLLITIAAIACSYGVGVSLALLSAFRGGRLDSALMSLIDVLLAFPPLIFVLVLVAGVGSGAEWIILGVTLISVPRIVRIMRGAVLDVVTREFVEAAIARAETTRWILFRELLPNIWPEILADLGVRLTGTILLIASLSFLGFGQQPPAADWGGLISEDLNGVLLNPWPVILPATFIAALTIGVNLLGDGFVRVLGRSGVSAIDEAKA